MHSRIFHIMPTLEGVQNNTKSCDEYSLESIGADYIVDTDDWDDNINWLMSGLPEGMFTMEKISIKEDEDTIVDYAKLTYSKYPKEYLEKYVSDIKEYADKLTIDNLKDYYSRWKFADLVKRNGIDFYIDQGGTWPDLNTFNDWVISIANDHKIGDTFYVGSIMDYHF